MSNCEKHHEHSHHCCVGTSSLHQTLDELEFERGIWSAAQCGDLERIKKLIGKGEVVDRRDMAGYTALHYAARNGHLDICKFLLNNGACIDATTRAGSATALHRACTAGKINIVDLLLSKKADVLLKDADGKTCLHRAAEKGFLEIYNKLLIHKPTLKDVEDNKSKTAMNYL